MAGDNVIASFLIALGFKADTSAQQQATKSVSDYEKAVKDAEARIVAARMARAKNADQVAALQMQADLKAAREALKIAKERDKADKDATKAQEEEDKKRRKAQAESTAFAIAKIQLVIHAFTELARAAKNAFSDTVHSFDQLYYAAGRTGASVNNIRSLSHAFSQVGGNSAQAVGAVESFTRALRNNPGLEGFVKGLGVDSKLDGVEKLLATVDKLNEQPHYIGVQQAEILGISEENFDLLTRQSAGIRKYREEYKQAAKAVGLNEEEAAKASQRFSQSMGSLSVILEVSFTKVLTAILPKISDWMDSFASWIRSHQGEIGEYIQSISAVVQAVGKFIGDMFTTFKSSIDDGSFKKGLLSFVTSMERIAKAIGDIVRGFQRLAALDNAVFGFLGKIFGDGSAEAHTNGAGGFGGPGGGGPGGGEGSLMPGGSTNGVRGGGGRGFVDGGGTIGKAQQGANASAVMDELKKAGYNDNAIAAIMGSMQSESSFNPAIINDSGHTGLWQWDKDKRWPKIQKWIKDQGGDPKDARWQTKAWIAEHTAKPGDALYDGKDTARGGEILRNNPNSVNEALEGVRLSERYGAGEEGGRGANARAWLPHVNGTAPKPSEDAAGKPGDPSKLTLSGTQATAGGEAEAGTVAAAAWAEKNLEGFRAISALNDKFHKENKPHSKHTKGLAADLAFDRSASYRQYRENAEKLRDHLRAAGLRNGVDFMVRDEKNDPSPGATGPHIHVQFNDPDAAAKYAAFAAGQRTPAVTAANQNKSTTPAPTAPHKPSFNMTPGGFDVNQYLKPPAPLGNTSNNTNNSQNNKSVKQTNHVKVDIHGSNDPSHHGRVMESSLGRVHQLALENAQGAVRA